MWTVPRTYVAGEIVTAAILNTDHRDNLNALLPLGAYILRAANYTTTETAVESRWLQCNGVAVSRTTYATLFNHLNGLTPALPFGVGDGSTTFTLPDLRGRVPVGEGEHSSVDVMGDSDGVAIANRRPQHRHTPHFTQVGTGSGGGAAISAPASFANTQASPQSDDGGSGVAADPLDGPAHLVFGSYFIKYTA